MGLEKSLKNALAVFSTCIMLCCQDPTPDSEPNEEEPIYDYTTTTTIVQSQYIDSSGGTINVNNPNSLINGTELTIPSGALTLETLVSIGEVNNPPKLPAGLNYVGTPVDLEPDGINFNTSSIIKIPYSDESLSDAGLSDDSNLKLYYYDKSLNNWFEANIISLDTTNNLLTAQLDHFSYYAITGLSATPPEDLGTPQPGDLLYTLGTFLGDDFPLEGWYPGHVGIYVGEKVDSEGNKYNVIEAQYPIVRRNYYNPISEFSGANVYMGAREPKGVILTPQQREDIVEYVENQVGKEYVIGETIGVMFGMLRGSLVKGPNRFNCVGLAEKAYEEAGVNNSEGLVSWWDEEIGNGIEGLLMAVLTPAEQYKNTKPSSGYQFKIPFVSFTGTRDEDNSQTQIVVMNEDGTEFHEITSGSFRKDYPRLSPNRDKIIFEFWNQEESSEYFPTLYTMGLDGSGLTKIIGGEKCREPAWSSKNKIAFVPRYGLTVIYFFDIFNPDIKEKLSSRYEVEKTPSFSPEGNSALYFYNARDIVQIDLATRNRVTLIPGDWQLGIHNKEPEFSPDGKKIVFSSNMYDNDNRDIYIYDINSKGIQRLTYDSSLESSPHFSHDSLKIFYVSDLPGTYQIYSMNVDGSNQRQLTQGPKNYDFGDY